MFGCLIDFTTFGTKWASECLHIQTYICLDSLVWTDPPARKVAGVIINSWGLIESNCKQGAPFLCGKFSTRMCCLACSAENVYQKPVCFLLKGPNTVVWRVQKMYSESGGPVRQVDNFGECLLVSISYHIALVNHRTFGWGCTTQKKKKQNAKDKMGQLVSGARFVWKGPVFV